MITAKARQYLTPIFMSLLMLGVAMLAVPSTHATTTSGITTCISAAYSPLGLDVMTFEYPEATDTSDSACDDLRVLEEAEDTEIKHTNNRGAWGSSTGQFQGYANGQHWRHNNIGAGQGYGSIGNQRYRSSQIGNISNYRFDSGQTVRCNTVGSITRCTKY
jgi:hypothetical protein